MRFVFQMVKVACDWVPYRIFRLCPFAFLSGDKHDFQPENQNHAEK